MSGLAALIILGVVAWAGWVIGRLEEENARMKRDIPLVLDAEHAPDDLAGTAPYLSRNQQRGDA